MKSSWIHLSRGRVPKQAHVAVPRDLKEEEIGRGGFQGRVAEVYRRNEPVGWVRVEGPHAPGDVDGERLEPPDLRDAEGGRLRFASNADVTVWISRRREPMPWCFRNADADELHFVHRGRGTLETEFGPLRFAPGDYLVLPKGVTWRLVPETRDNYFLVLETAGEIGFAEHTLLGRHNPWDPTVIEVPEPEVHEGDGRAEYEVRVQRAGEITRFFHPTHPFDVVGWKGDLFPFRFHNRDFRPVTADRNHVPPTAFALFQGPGFVVCNFVPHPVQMDREAARLPYYHRNMDYDEIGFLHAGTLGGNPMTGTTIIWHPRGATHGPGEEARAAAEAAWDQITGDDLEAVNVDCERPLALSDAARAALRDHVQLISGRAAAAEAD